MTECDTKFSTFYFELTIRQLAPQQLYIPVSYITAGISPGNSITIRSTKYVRQRSVSHVLQLLFDVRLTRQARRNSFCGLLLLPVKAACSYDVYDTELDNMYTTTPIISNMCDLLCCAMGVTDIPYSSRKTSSQGILMLHRQLLKPILLQINTRLSLAPEQGTRASKPDVGNKTAWDRAHMKPDSQKLRDYDKIIMHINID